MLQSSPLNLLCMFACIESAHGDYVFERKMVLWALSVRGAQIPELTGCAWRPHTPTNTGSDACHLAFEIDKQILAEDLGQLVKAIL